MIMKKLLGKRMTLRVKFILLGGSILAAVMTVLFCWMLVQSEEAVMNQVDAQAQSLLNQIVITRQWIADQDGLYVRKSAARTTNPFLPNTDIVDRSGLHYVLRNPAMVTRQLSELSGNSKHYRFRITSRQLRNPANAPNAFEQDALVQFERRGFDKTRNGIARRDIEDGVPVYRRIIPLRVEEACLGCHRDQGYRVGDVRGGISVTIPLDSAVAAIARTRLRLISAGAAIILLIAGSLYFIVHRLVLRPVDHLHQVAEGINAGQFETLATIRSGDEFEDLAESVNRMTQRVRTGYEGAVKSLAAAIDARDPYTRGHIDRVARYTFAIARELGWSREERRKWKMGVVLHDVGKIGIRDAVLQKQKYLTDDERAEMQAHPRIGAEIAIASESDLLIRELPAILYHHEWFDGRGYPAGLKGEDIPPIARVLAVADVYDALITDRPYRKAMTDENALAVILDGSGTQFDPEVVKAFLAAWAKGFADDTLVEDDSDLVLERT
ncbi:MAG: DUF3365 domain-containing protein [Nitrospirota bacterium]|nr:DUF3365 domain-containing protein [Nitrospirota bacterium]